MDLKRAMHKRLAYIYLYSAALLLSIFALFPFFWMVSTSLKTEAETFQMPPTWIPQTLTLGSYITMWKLQPWLRYFANSLLVSLCTALLAMFIASPAGYGLSRLRTRASNNIVTFILLTQMIPGVLLIIPYFKLISKLGLYNTYIGLIIAYVSFALPYCAWTLKGFFDSIPYELDEAAMIDGCTRFGAFVKVVLPLSAPGLVATFIFAFILAWGELLFGLALTSKQEMYLVPVGISFNMGQYIITWNYLMAAAVLATLPTICLYTLLERYLVAGLSAGAVKG